MRDPLERINPRIAGERTTHEVTKFCPGDLRRCLEKRRQGKQDLERHVKARPDRNGDLARASLELETTPRVFSRADAR
jgi:hypothetical protein